MPNTHRIQQPALDSPQKLYAGLRGHVGQRLADNQAHWLLRARDANPGIIEAFTLRDRQPRQKLVPWYGEFPGKLLTGAVLCWHLHPSKPLHAMIEGLVADLARVQDADGYLGPYPRHERLTGRTWDGKGDLWDIWGHYHCLLGLLWWHQASGDAQALKVCIKAADHLCDAFLDTDRHVFDAGAHEMNLAVAHGLCLLYEQTGEPRYLRLAREVEQDWQITPAGDYVRSALAGVPFFESPKPRWESLHDIQAIAELYWLTGEEDYRRAYTHIWESIARTDRHNTGGFSSGERAQGQPYHQGAIETCCTIAWIALSIDMLRLTGRSVVADEIELATFNGMFGAQQGAGSWWTYNTPMDGERHAFYHDHNFQCLAASPEFNCCSANGARGLGMLAQWALMTAADGLTLNYYGPGQLTATTPGGQLLVLFLRTDYPRTAAVEVGVGIESDEELTLRLRIPGWSRQTQVWLNDAPLPQPAPGDYLALRRTWQTGDTIRLELDLTPHYWVGAQECAGLTSVYRGPILLTYDPRYNAMDPDEVPTLSTAALAAGELVSWTDAPAPWVLVEVPVANGGVLRLCDFASAGATGTYYRSWLPVEGASQGGFTFNRFG